MPPANSGSSAGHSEPLSPVYPVDVPDGIFGHVKVYKKQKDKTSKKKKLTTLFRAKKHTVIG